MIPEELNKIVINLVSNACDAVLDKKKKNVNFEAKIKIATKLINKQLIELVVQDNGEGISAELANVIYNPFETTKTPGKGVGLGLHIVYDLVTKNGGQIWWERKTGMTQFIVKTSR
ncbi:MAG: GHKL domain-containing protein [Hydrococcus sp. RU_2_2]|nr:GHKL domain-containing protein [Hydrococcus sp. RU_2_2]